MNQNMDSSYRRERPQEIRQIIETLKAPIIQLGKKIGVEIIEDYDQGAGPIDVLWTFKPGCEALPDIRMGFVCIPIITTAEEDYSEFTINEIIIKSMMNIVDKLVIVVPAENMAKRIIDSIESMPNSSFLQLRKYVTVLTPSTLVPKTDVLRSRERKEEGEMIE